MRQSNTVVLEKGSGGADAPVLADLLERGLQALGSGLDLEQLAKETGALVRHRGVATASDLLRLVFGYSALEYSLRQLGAWASLLGIAQLSKTALLNRRRKCPRWLGVLIVLALEQQHLALPKHLAVRLKVMEASVVCQPGSRGADWRLHLGFDVAAGCLDQIDLSDGTGSERADRFDCQAGEIWLGDRAYALAKSLAHFVFSGAWLVVRTGWNRLAWQDALGQPFDLMAWLKQAHVTPSSPQETHVWIPSPAGRFPLRLVAQALPEAAAEAARRRARQAARKNHHTVDERSLFTAGFIVLLSNLPVEPYGPQVVLELYRFRWQIELAFKRLKSLLDLDHLRTQDPQLAQVYLLSKLLALIWMERPQLQLLAEHPAVFGAQDRPVSFWRLTALLWEAVRAQIRGVISLDQSLANFPKLLRYLCDEPRARPQQLAKARSLLAGLGGS